MLRKERGSGDEDTDEDGFRAMGGKNLPLLVRSTPRESKATVRFDGTAVLVQFMDR
jgi:hypothetical protein